MPSDRQHLVDAYWKNYALTHGSSEERLQADEWFWAWIEVEDCVRAATPDVFDLVLALVVSAPNDDALSYVGAGPMEDLINWHGAAFVHRIEESARQNRAFRSSDTETMRPTLVRKPLGTLALVVVALLGVFAAIGLARSAFLSASNLSSIVLTWQGAVVLAITFAWGLGDAVLLRRVARPPFADRAAAMRGLRARAVLAVISLLIVAVDLGLLVTAGMAIGTA